MMTAQQQTELAKAAKQITVEEINRQMQGILDRARHTPRGPQREADKARFQRLLAHRHELIGR